MNISTQQFDPIFIPISNLLFETGNRQIDQLNLNRIIVKAMNESSGLGWEQDFAEEVAAMYRAFLFLCKLYPKEVIVPIKEVDDLWHLHILDTRNYQKDCQLIFGHYLHHYPYAGLKEKISINNQEEEYILRTLELMSNHFPQMVEEI